MGVFILTLDASSSTEYDAKWSLPHTLLPEPSVAPSQASAEPVGPVVKPESEGVVGVRVSRNPLAYPGYLGKFCCQKSKNSK